MSRFAHQFKHAVQVGRVGPAQINHGFEDTGNILSIAQHDNVVRCLIIDQITDVTLGLGRFAGGETGVKVVHLFILRHRDTLGSLTGFDPVDVSNQRIDLSIMSKHTHGLSQRPSRTGVG